MHKTLTSFFLLLVWFAQITGDFALKINFHSQKNSTVAGRCVFSESGETGTPVSYAELASRENEEEKESVPLFFITGNFISSFIAPSFTFCNSAFSFFPGCLHDSPIFLLNKTLRI